MTTVILIAALATLSGQPPKPATAPQPATTQVKEYGISVAKIESVKEWKDPAGGDYAPRIKAEEGEEILLVTVRIEAPGRFQLKGISATNANGDAYRCVFSEAREERYAADGKPSTATVTFTRVLPFVVPVGTKLANLVLEGVEVPIQSSPAKR